MLGGVFSARGGKALRAGTQSEAGSRVQEPRAPGARGGAQGKGVAGRVRSACGVRGWGSPSGSTPAGVLPSGCLGVGVDLGLAWVALPGDGLARGSGCWGFWGVRAILRCACGCALASVCGGLRRAQITRSRSCGGCSRAGAWAHRHRGTGDLGARMCAGTGQVATGARVGGRPRAQHLQGCRAPVFSRLR